MNVIKIIRNQKKKCLYLLEHKPKLRYKNERHLNSGIGKSPEADTIKVDVKIFRRNRNQLT